MSPRDHVAECAVIVLAKPAIGGGEDACKFLAAADYLSVAQLFFRFRYPWNGKFAAFQPRNIFRVLFRRYHFVVTAAEEIEQVVEKLSNVGRPDVVLQAELTDSLAEIDPEIFLVEDTEILAGALEQMVTVIVECGGVNLMTEERTHAISHFGSGSHGISERDDLVGLRTSFLHQAGNTMDENRRFAGTSAGDNQHRPVNMVNSFSLAIVRKKGSRL